MLFDVDNLEFGSSVIWSFLCFPTHFDISLSFSFTGIYYSCLKHELQHTICDVCSDNWM